MTTAVKMLKHAVVPVRLLTAVFDRRQVLWGGEIMGVVFVMVT